MPERTDRFAGPYTTDEILFGATVANTAALFAIGACLASMLRLEPTAILVFFFAAVLLWVLGIRFRRCGARVDRPDPRKSVIDLLSLGVSYLGVTCLAGMWVLTPPVGPYLAFLLLALCGGAVLARAVTSWKTSGVATRVARVVVPLFWFVLAGNTFADGSALTTAGGAGGAAFCSLPAIAGGFLLALYRRSRQRRAAQNEDEK